MIDRVMDPASWWASSIIINIFTRTTARDGWNVDLRVVKRELTGGCWQARDETRSETYKSSPRRDRGRDAGRSQRPAGSRVLCAPVTHQNKAEMGTEPEYGQMRRAFVATRKYALFRTYNSICRNLLIMHRSNMTRMSCTPALELSRKRESMTVVQIRGLSRWRGALGLRGWKRKRGPSPKRETARLDLPRFRLRAVNPKVFQQAHTQEFHVTVNRLN